MDNKRGQLVIIVIVAIVIVAVVLTVFLFPRVDIGIGREVNPSSFLRNCIEPKVEETLEVLSKQGGHIDPNNYVLYRGEKIQYLCYTTNNYKPCLVQEPLLVGHVENEIKKQVEPVARQCMQNLKERYERRGYEVSTSAGGLDVSFSPGKLVVDFLSPMTVTKESTQAFRKFAISIDTEMYDLLLTAVSILQFESSLGDSEITLYLQFYPDLSIEKIKREGDTIYKLKNVVSRDEFTFASRSLVWPPGYGFEEL
ncbi:MAG: hypothetical protein IIA87_02050 [Nanoarchaeota archaeon]|nr:hypothetical protein [Nanoarchaeota archaeon]